MEDSAFSDAFCRFLQRSVPSVSAAEMLLVLAKHPDRWWEANELIASLPQGGSVSEREAWSYIEINWGQLVAIGTDRKIQYRPAHRDLDPCVQTLKRAYNERPVTLIRVIYALRDSKIQTFADAFKITRY